MLVVCCWLFVVGCWLLVSPCPHLNPELRSAALTLLLPISQFQSRCQILTVPSLLPATIH
ncbi:MAG TPA: hypothetical protein DEG47_16230 [Cyanobacteria bacterium UBA11148]|nr:hypothetical protein [Cyanobacteria bacterium UBA11148]